MARLAVCGIFTLLRMSIYYFKIDKEIITMFFYLYFPLKLSDGVRVTRQRTHF
jgi:hypothetical protein